MRTHKNVEEIVFSAEKRQEMFDELGQVFKNGTLQNNYQSLRQENGLK